MKRCAAIVLLLALTGCTAAPAELTLVETKSTVQLLRNETATRVPKDVLLSVVKSEDRSEACDIGDPIRSWRSSVTLNISAQRAQEARQLWADLVASYVDEGWRQGNVGDREAVLTTTESVATIDILVTEDADRDGDGASIIVLVTGPCVTTDGYDSDEVAQLEGR
jgi:hypothetical protein